MKASEEILKDITKEYFQRYWKKLLMWDIKKVCIIVEKLRVIILTEANFNIVNKLFIGIIITKEADAIQELPTDN